jgi:hypothetical protein
MNWSLTISIRTSSRTFLSTFSSGSFESKISDF